MLHAPLVADPGTRWEYGISTDWLGQVVEAVSGSDLAGYCEDRIFAPLAMPDATFRPSDEQAARMMALHQRTPDGDLIQQSIELAEPEFFMGGSGAYATAPDYLRFMRALLRGGELDGERVLGPRPSSSRSATTSTGRRYQTPCPRRCPSSRTRCPACRSSRAGGWGSICSSRTSRRMRRAGAATGVACSTATTGSTEPPASPGSCSRRSCRSTTRRSSRRRRRLRGGRLRRARRAALGLDLLGAAHGTRRGAVLIE